MSEERDDIIVLVDESGEECEFEHLDTIEMNGNEYVVLLPTNENDEDDEDLAVIILKVEPSEDEDNFVTIEDEGELNQVFEEFQSRLAEEKAD